MEVEIIHEMPAVFHKVMRSYPYSSTTSYASNGRKVEIRIHETGRIYRSVESTTKFQRKIRRFFTACSDPIPIPLHPPIDEKWRKESTKRAYSSVSWK